MVSGHHVAVLPDTTDTIYCVGKNPPKNTQSEFKLINLIAAFPTYTNLEAKLARLS